MKPLPSILLLLLLALPAGAAIYYCSPNGGGSGADFNSLATFNGNGTRGNTYKLVDGNYGSITLNSPASGTTTITVEKVTSADSAVAGYSSDKHDGQATFSSIIVNDPYYIIDGKVRSAWKNGNYGFRIMEIGADSLNGDNADYLIVRYCDLGDTYSESYPGVMNATAARFVYNQNNLTFQYCWMHTYSGAGMQMAGCHDVTVEYCFFGPGWGKEAIRGGNDNMGYNYIIRYNIFQDASQVYIDDPEQSGGITAEIGIWDAPSAGQLDNNQVYGNVFTNQFSGGRNHAILIGGNGSAGDGVGANNCKVYNNTFIGIREGSTGPLIYLQNGSGNEIKNNLFYNCIDSDVSANTTAYNLVITTNAFVSPSAFNFALLGPVPTGETLSSPWNTDPNGTTRGGGGWEIGAYEYGGTIYPPVINSSLTAVATNGLAFSYSITTSNSATSFGATPLPLGVTHSAGLLSGTPSTSVSYSTNTTITATNSAGQDSETLVITVYNGLAPTLTTSPVAKTNSAATGVSLTSVATSTYGTPTYQWQSNSINISGATSANYTKIPADATADSGLYRVIATNNWGSVTSSAVYVSLTNSTAIPVVTVTNYSGNINVAVSTWFSATENPTAYAVSNLPTGLTVSSNHISGTPTVAQTNVIVVYATNANGVGSNTATYSIASVVSSNITVGGRVIVNVSPDLRVRDAAALAGNILGVQNYQAEGTVLSGPTTADGYTWWEIDYDTAPDGWSIEGTGGVYWLVVAPPGGDTTAPSITQSTPGSGMVTNVAGIVVTGTASDNAGLTSVKYRWTFPDGTHTDVITATGTTSWSFPATLQSGSNYFNIWATDTSSNTNATSMGITYIPARRVFVGDLRIGGSP